MTEQRYHVAGMTCGHCVNHITEEVTQVPGVSHVHVDLEANSVTVSGTELDDAQVRAAIAEAGYTVTV
ncbi:MULTISPECIES: heavy-metal-associated domain-containing protein [unclassified Streptomyces]|uniref:heavy-metal-associated domain-containing protein n=1 Tax=unclassified Streptomyces TaxID=2593676 RepID=UPI002E2D4B6E|nr:heavy-metal-associated domain-containing protein [Streptomyces sp. NBC_01429]